MTFDGLYFYIFLVGVLVIFNFLNRPFKWVILLSASYFFYGSLRVEYLGLLFISTLTDFLCAQRIEANEDPAVRKRWLITSLTVNLSLLAAFKYFVVLPEIWDFSLRDGSTVDLIIPIGISFYTFQTMGYTIDVYRRKIQAERHLGHFALYVAFFPQLVAGPIERARNLLPQLKGFKRWISPADLSAGVRLIIVGLFLKVVVGDSLRLMIVPILEQPEGYAGWVYVLVLVLFTFWVYADFRAYCDIAIGVARLFGVKLSPNFDRPIFAGSIRAIWRKWHMTLLSWFKDYVYIPLGGSRKGLGRTYINIFIVFALSGLWHGSSIHILFFGIFHGVIFLLEMWLLRDKQIKSGLVRYGIWLVSLVVWSFGWLFFDVGDASDVTYVASHLFSSGASITEMPGFLWTTFEITLLGIAALLFLDAINKKGRANPVDALGSTVVRWGVYNIMLIAIITLSSTHSQDFIYFQF